MSSNINESIRHLVVPIDSLKQLEANPRRGDVEAIMASLVEFGQVTPIVVKPNGDGTSTVLAGNHRVMAAKRLGWADIAVVEFDADDSTAVAFALADNRVSDLGTIDSEVLYDSIVNVLDSHGELFERLGWDDFELASMDQVSNASPISSAYVAPVIVDTSWDRNETGTNPPQKSVSHIVSDGDSNDVAVRGASTVGAAGAKGVVQYTLIFDDADQQKRWYDFLRWLRVDPGTDGDTTVRRLINFVEDHANF